jgi:FixJ family two-component response regulator
MPGISGEKFVRMLRESGINTPVLYMTSKDSISKFNDIKNELKFSGLIVKPFTKDEFINSIESGLYDKKKI